MTDTPRQGSTAGAPNDAPPAASPATSPAAGTDASHVADARDRADAPGDLTAILTLRAADLREWLRSAVGEEEQAEPGSDASLLLGALCGAQPETYLPAFAASARRLAEHGGRLEARMEGIGRWAQALSGALLDLFGDQPRIQAAAQARLTTIATRVAQALAQGSQEATSDQAASDAEHARRGLTRLNALQRINAAANSTLDLDQTLTTTATAVAQEMRADMCTIFLFDEVTRELLLRATSGDYPEDGRHFTLMLGEGHTGWVAERGHPLILNDVLNDERFRTETQSYREPYRGVLAVPIIFFTVEKLEGVISVQTREPRQFTDEEVHFLEIVAGQLAMSIENGRLYEQTDEELRRKVHELGTLYRVSSMVASTLVFDQVLEMIVGQAVQLSGAERSVLFELETATKQLRAIASHGFESSDLERALLPMGQCCAGVVVQTGEPRMHMDCMRTDPCCFLASHPEAIDDQHAVLCVPLATRHGPIGALCVFSSQRHMLNNHQLQLVITFANVAAIAMENARLFEQTREGLRTKEVLLREMHHRVKNNLQQVASILNMQRRRAKSSEVQQILAESVDRIQGIAATHDLLSNAELGMARIDEIARKIVGIVRGNLVPPTLRLRFHVGEINYYLPTEQATTLAIALNELIANAIEHGFEGYERGNIRISGSREGDEVVVRVADDGMGLPQDFSLQSNDGLGLQLVRGLVQSDLRGRVEVFEMQGLPDLGGRAERLLDAAISMPGDGNSGDGDSGDGEQRWVVFQLSFPVALTAEAQQTQAEALRSSVSGPEK